MAQIHLIVGPVGSGKSTFALALAREHNAVRFTLDDWMTSLFSPDRPEEGVMPWYVERSRRCVDMIWKLTSQLIETGTNVVLEIGLIQRPDRDRLYARVDGKGYPMRIYVLDATREIRWERVQKRNQERGSTFSMVVPQAIFELASNLWERPDEEECRGRDVTFVDTDL